MMFLSVSFKFPEVCIGWQTLFIPLIDYSPYFLSTLRTFPSIHFYVSLLKRLTHLQKSLSLNHLLRLLRSHLQRFQTSIYLAIYRDFLRDKGSLIFVNSRLSIETLTGVYGNMRKSNTNVLEPILYCTQL